jgi:hypothetical protein
VRSEIRKVRIRRSRSRVGVEMPDRSGLTTSRLNAMREALTELVTLVPNRFVTDNHTALEQ